MKDHFKSKLVNNAPVETIFNLFLQRTNSCKKTGVGCIILFYLREVAMKQVK